MVRLPNGAANLSNDGSVTVVTVTAITLGGNVASARVGECLSLECHKGLLSPSRPGPLFPRSGPLFVHCDHGKKNPRRPRRPTGLLLRMTDGYAASSKLMSLSRRS